MDGERYDKNARPGLRKMGDDYRNVIQGHLR